MIAMRYCPLCFVSLKGNTLHMYGHFKVHAFELENALEAVVWAAVKANEKFLERILGPDGVKRALLTADFLPIEPVS